MREHTRLFRSRIQRRDILVGGIDHETCTVGGTLECGVVDQHKDAVRCDVQIGFEAVDGGHGGDEGRHGILSEAGVSITSMTNHQSGRSMDNSSAKVKHGAIWIRGWSEESEDGMLLDAQCSSGTDEQQE